MANPNFGAILDKPASSIERPKPLPTGTYTCVVKGLPRQDKSSKKQTEFVEFSLGILAAGEDVDQDDLKAALTKASGETVPLGEKIIKATYYLTEDAVYRLKDFLKDDLQIDDEEDGEERDLRTMIGDAPGRQVLATLKHRASEDGKSVFAELAGTAPVE